MRAPTPADDNLHEPLDDHPFWTETAWFAFAVPERNITGFVYPVFRPNQDIASSGIYVWDNSGETDLDCLYAHNYWHVPLPESLTSMDLISGLSYEVVEPMHSYRVRYTSDDCSLDLHFEGLHQPILSPKEDHLDQPCRVTGTITLVDEVIPVDGYEIRDKSWHVRSDDSLVLPDRVSEGSYMYAINGEDAFLARTMGADIDRDTLRRGGWLLRDGVCSPLVEGRRRVERDDDGYARRVHVSGRDELDREFTAVGESVNRFIYRSTPAMSPWIYGVNWDLDGKPAWGENQEWTLKRRARAAGTPNPGLLRGSNCA